MSEQHPFDPLSPQAAQLLTRRAKRAEIMATRHMDIRSAFANAHGAVAYLRDCLAHANAQPSYVPGHDPQIVAYNEGRRAALRELVAVIDDAFQPQPTTPEPKGP